MNAKPKAPRMPRPEREVEIKLLADAADLPRIAALALVRDRLVAQADPVRLHTSYYDTPGLALAKRGLALRLRRQGMRREQSVKTMSTHEAGDGAGIAVRREWRWEVAGDGLDTGLLRQGDLSELIPREALDNLSPLFTTDVQRTVLMLRAGSDGRVELALDLGQALVMAPDGQPAARHTVSEVELELQQGEVADLFRLAADIHARIPLRLSTRSKADLGLALLTGAQPRAHAVRPLGITPITTVMEAFRHIGRNGLAHLLDNQPAFTEAMGDPAALREMASAVRRLITAYGLFADLIHTDQGDALRDQLKQLGRKLERARDWQKLAMALTELPAEARKGAVGPVSAARALALDKAMRMLASPAWTGWQLEFAAWLETGDWARQPHGCPFGTTLAEIAGDMLRIRLDKLRALGLPGDVATAIKAHKRLRKLRYDLDFCRAVWPAERVAPLQRTVDALRTPLKQADDDMKAAALLDKIDQPAAADALRKRAAAALKPLPALWTAFVTAEVVGVAG
ncbi:CHAD domain-containing protein [Niveispirillum sp. KHB5.9]|uniref:CYTH and CHAD domain-containing protein n=1 Tax=Niveispirillum sp. KHB5.9 TaxID=3400269 RepID=UPI003A8C4905